MMDTIPDRKAISASEEPCQQASWATVGSVAESGWAGFVRRLQLGHWGLALYRIAWRFPRWMFRFNQGTLIRTRVHPLPHRMNPRHTHSFANQSDLPEISEITGHSEEDLTRRMQECGECLVTRDTGCDDRIINVQWMYRGNTFVKGLGLWVEIDSDSAYTYGSYTVPSCRMRGVFQTALNQTIGALGEQGVTSVYCLIERVNGASYRSHMRLGYEPVTRVSHLVLLGLKITLTRDYSTSRRRVKMFFRYPRNSFII